MGRLLLPVLLAALATGCHDSGSSAGNPAPQAFALAQPDPETVLQRVEGMANPWGAHYDGTHFIVADSSNHRVLIWNSIPTSTQEIPDLVVGQPDLSSNFANNGGVSSRSLNVPLGVFSDGTRLFVAERLNHRVLIWNTIPTSDHHPAGGGVGYEEA